jgi:hypothetical protein
MIENEEIAGFCILFLFLVFALFVSPASAQTPTVSINNASAIPDSSVTLPIIVKNVTNLGSGTIKVTYNPAVVHVTEVTSGTETGTETEESLIVQEWYADNDKGAVRIVAWDTKAACSGSVIFANVTYKTVGEEGSSTALNITVGDLADYYNYTQIPYTITNGTLTIIPASSNISKCFIATAAYGTPLHEDIDVLRDFRDEYLMTNPLGKEFVKMYYATSPPIAEALRENEGLRTVTRLSLITSLVSLSEFALSGIWILFIIGLAAVILYFRRYIMRILKSLLVLTGVIFGFIAVIFSLGFLGYTIPFCAVLAAFMLPLVIPVAVALMIFTLLDIRKK